MPSGAGRALLKTYDPQPLDKEHEMAERETGAGGVAAIAEADAPCSRRWSR